jgi:hypothetical protein
MYSRKIVVLRFGLGVWRDTTAYQHVAVDFAIPPGHEAVQPGGRAAGGDGCFAAHEFLACNAVPRSRRKLRRARTAPGIDGGPNIHKALFAVE